MLVCQEKEREREGGGTYPFLCKRVIVNLTRDGERKRQAFFVLLMKKDVRAMERYKCYQVIMFTEWPVIFCCCEIPYVLCILLA